MEERAMGLGASIKKVLKIVLMSLGASSPDKKPSPPPPGKKPGSQA
jgi:hypothetical protein